MSSERKTGDQDHQRRLHDTLEKHAAQYGLTLGDKTTILHAVQDRDGLLRDPAYGYSFVDSEGEPALIPMPIRRSNGAIDKTGWRAVGMSERVVDDQGNTEPYYLMVNDQVGHKHVSAAKQDALVQEIEAAREANRHEQSPDLGNSAVKRASIEVAVNEGIGSSLDPLNACLTPEQHAALKREVAEDDRLGAQSPKERLTAGLGADDKRLLDEYALRLRFKANAQRDQRGADSTRNGELAGQAYRRMSAAARAIAGQYADL